MNIPHVIPYQGSKRKIAGDILSQIKYEVNGTFYEPFAGSAALTMAAVGNRLAARYVIGDKYNVLAELWNLIIEEPDRAYREYKEIWEGQLVNPMHFNMIRDEFNNDSDPAKFLYLIARCVKNAIRFNGNGEFNQSPDKRRKGMNPEKLKKQALLASTLLKGSTEVRGGDFMDIVHDATSNDVIYMDPPWQGTSTRKDTRYAFVLDIDHLIVSLENMNDRGIPFLLSFDGSCGDRTYGKALPSHLELKKVGINAGRSSQATLLGRDDVTIESLYLSPALVEKNEAAQVTEVVEQMQLTAFA